MHARRFLIWFVLAHLLSACHAIVPLPRVATVPPHVPAATAIASPPATPTLVDTPIPRAAVSRPAPHATTTTLALTAASTTATILPSLPLAPAAGDSNRRVEIALFDSEARTATSGPIGSVVTITIAFRPTKDVNQVSRDGTPVGYSTNWSPHTVAEMRYCTAISRACSPSERWVRFSTEEHIALPIDWLGTRDLIITAQFRDATGVIVPAGARLAEAATSEMPVTGVLDARTPVASQPPAIQTTIALASAAFPVQGGVTVGPGHPLGAKAASRIDVPVRFAATSRGGVVVEMRVKRASMGRCLSESEMTDAPWEPFSLEKTFAVSVPLNWSTFKLHVQYRDDKGQLSPVYCSDVAIEGNP